MKVVLDFFVQHQIDIFNQKVAVACSGGADSQVLLQSLLDLRQKLKLDIHVLHFNHHLRGNASQADAAFVRKFSKDQRCKFFLGSAQVKSLAQKQKQSLEAAARQARYAFFEKVLKRESIPFLLTAHHADDQTETLFLNFIRGSGLEGLKGIDPVSYRKHYTLLRPLLGTPRQEVLQYLKARKLGYREDASNADTAFWRNKIRHEILPRVREINPGIHKSLAQMMDIVREELAQQESLATELFKKCLKKSARQQITLESATLYTLPRAQQRLVVRKACRTLKGDLRDISFDFVENFLKNQLNCLYFKNAGIQAKKI